MPHCIAQSRTPISRKCGICPRQEPDQWTTCPQEPRPNVTPPGRRAIRRHDQHPPTPHHSAETHVHRLQATIEARANPRHPDRHTQPHTSRTRHRSRQTQLPSDRTTSAAEVAVLINTIARQLNDASPANLQELYTALDLELLYNAEDRMLDVSIRSGRGSKRVRGARDALLTRRLLGRSCRPKPSR